MSTVSTPSTPGTPGTPGRAEVPSASITPEATPLVAVENLQVAFGHKTSEPVVRGVSFTIRRGECLALVGESGSGKSVTSRTLVGLTGTGSRIDFDRLDFEGRPVAGLSERAWRGIRGKRIGFVLQDALSSLDALRPVGREIAEPLKLHETLTRTQREERVIELLASVGVPEPEFRAKQYPDELSGGLRQRALIASAIACSPELLIADEPTTALDATIAAQIVRLLAALKSEERGLLMVSHDLSVVAELADRVAVMRQGEIVETGPTAQVLGDPQHEYTKELLAAVPSGASKGTRLSAAQPASIRRDKKADSRAGFHRARPERGTLLLEAEELVKEFEGVDGVRRRAVDGVSFELHAGEVLGIVGESGSGKTTTSRLVLGLERADSGSVLLRGRDLTRLSQAELRAERRHLQVVYQDPLSSFDPRYTVERILAEAVGVTGVTGRAARRKRVLELLELVRLDASFLDRRPIEISGGQRQRIAIARALAPEPEIIVCDEPVSALDVSVQARILDLFDDLRTDLGLAYLFISHDLGVIHHLCDRMVVMKDGRVVEQGEVQAVFESPQHDYTKTLLDAVPRLAAVR